MWKGESVACLSVYLAPFQAETSGRLAQWLTTCLMGIGGHVGSANAFQISKEILPMGLF
jgi:hypothetical protein